MTTKTLALWLFGLLSTAYSCNLNAQEARINPNDVTIVRDTWGTPHIFGKTDADVAYGLAWVDAEDAFASIQEMLLNTNEYMGRLQGEKGARTDFFVKAINAKEIVKANMKNISPAYLRYLEGYCQGLNDYAKAHPKEVRLKKAFPITPKKIVQGSLVVASFLLGVPDEVSRIMSEKKTTSEPVVGRGSNAYAANSTKTADGTTFLCGNPHFLVEGAFSFYEAHLHSDEGLNIMGACFHGASQIALGCNENLAWSHTYNYFDGVDAFELKMHPHKKLWYSVDGKWYKLEKKVKWLKVKIGKLVWSVPRKFYYSKFGPTFHNPAGKWVAVSALSYNSYLLGQQGYEMNKAKDWTSFKAAIDRQQLPIFNIVYADKTGNIFYKSNGAYPQRAYKDNPEGTLRGDTSLMIWKGIYPPDSFPQVLNPPSGYVYNCNNTPYHATAPDENTQQHRLPASFDLRPGDNNRSYRIFEQLSESDKLSFEAFKQFKFDRKISAQARFIPEMRAVMNRFDVTKYPEYAEIITMAKAFGGEYNPDDVNATAFLVMSTYIFDKKHWGDDKFVTGIEAIEDDLVIQALGYTKNFLLTNYKRLEVKPREVFCYLAPSGKAYETLGFPDALMANYFKKAGKDSPHYKMHYGDSYIFFVNFDKNGVKHLETLLPTAPTNEKGYASQLDVYNQRQARPMSLDKEEVMKTAVKTYHPGE